MADIISIDRAQKRQDAPQIGVIGTQKQQDTAEIVIICRADMKNSWSIFPRYRPEESRPHEYCITIYCNNPKLISVFLKQAEAAWNKGCRNTE